MNTRTATTAQRRPILAILLISAFVVILNETTMNVALATIMADFGVDERAAQWLTTGFMLTMAVVIPVTGWLIDRLPTRRIFVIAMTLFSIGTLVCAVAPSFGVLLAGRVIQASGTAMMMPLLMTTVMQLVEPTHRGAIMGNISLVISVAPAVGPTLSGMLLEFGSWRLVFGTVLPIALTMLVLGIARLRNTGIVHRTPLDLLSVVLTVVGFGPLVYGLSLIGDGAAPSWEAPAALAAGVVGVAAFVRRQLVLQRSDTALLDLRTLAYSGYRTGLIMMALTTMALFGTIIMLPLVLQRSYGLEPISVGLMMLPGGIAMGVLGPLVGRLYDRVGPRALVTPATFVVLAAFLFLGTLSATTPWWLIMTGHVVMSAGFAFIFTPLFTLALGALPKPLYSYGSATLGTIQQVGGAAGTAIFVTIFSLGTDASLAAGATKGQALLTGSHGAFLGAAAVWSAAVITSLFLRRPAVSTPGSAETGAPGPADTGHVTAA
ncbi:MAG: MDR family MFS transporter [Propioniciclava sp.]